ncbi:hypothetical protein [Caulobacter sp. NIBR2454]|uniref:hypothetical protein n=1 Tax=Caulobacter sp. NIBR2454 TaxID=3015996 RepID=UPI0022B74703|nr:hypothetical protein [Caulobacter sp. NIBR2454]
MSDALNPALSDAKDAKSAARDAVAETKRSFKDTASVAKAGLTDAAHKAEKALKESAEVLRAQSRTYVDNAGQYFDEGQRYVVERVKERPVTATLAGVGVGLLLGLLLANRSNHR